MIAIADNLNTRNNEYIKALEKKDKKTLVTIMKKLADAGADVINLQCSLDGSDDEKTLPWITKILSASTKCAIGLDSRNVQALEKALPLCKRPPLINFVSQTEPDDQEQLLSLVAGSGASLVIRASKGVIPNSLEAKLQILENLLEMANDADIPNERIYADPSIIHIGRGMGQKNLMNSYECIRILSELVEPPVNTIAWISNVSSGLKKAVRKPLEAHFLTYLSGAGLSAVMVDILDPDIRRAIYLIKAYREEVVFSQTDIA
jgi:5-methyltetrahydrofolate--homocysteine methyltransferase